MKQYLNKTLAKLQLAYDFCQKIYWLLFLSKKTLAMIISIVMIFHSITADLEVFMSSSQDT